MADEKGVAGHAQMVGDGGGERPASGNGMPSANLNAPNKPEMVPDQEPVLTEANGEDLKDQEPSSKPDTGTKEARVKASSVLVATAIVIGAPLLLYVVYEALPLVLLLFVALLVATAIEPLVNWFRHGPFTRTAGIL